MDLTQLAAQQAQQHQERREDGRELRDAIVTAVGGLATESRDAHTSLAARQAELSTRLAVIEAGGLGAWERRGLLTGGLVVLLLLILLLAESRGVATAGAIRGVRELTPMAGAAEPSHPDPLGGNLEP